MPTISSLYSNLARQGLAKSLSHGYAQSVVAATHPVSYPNQHNRSAFSRRPSRLGRLASYQFQNAFHTNASLASPGLSVQEGRPEKSHIAHGGLDAYFEAWNERQEAPEAEQEWTQFQFAKRIEWTAPSPAVAELLNPEASTVVEAASRTASIERSYSESAVEDIRDAETEAVALSNVDVQIAEEINQNFADELSSALLARVPSPPVAPFQSPALTIETILERSPSSATSVSSSHLQSENFAVHLNKLAEAKRYAEIPVIFNSMLVGGIQPSASAYSALLNARINFPGTERTQLVPKALDVYSDMLHRKVAPNTEIYETLLTLVATRSLEISASKKSMEEKRVRYGGMEEAGKFMFASNELTLDILSEEDRLDFAVKIFTASLAAHKAGKYSAETYQQLISACVEAGRIPDMITLYENMELSRVTPLTSTFAAMIQGFTNSKDLSAAVEVYNEYKSLAISHDNGEIEVSDRHDALVYAAVIKAYVDSGKLEGAMKFYNKLVATSNTEVAGFRDTLVAKGLVQGHLGQGNLAEALSWARGLSSDAKALSMSTIATAAADKGSKAIAMSAFANIPVDYAGIVRPATALLALSVRVGDVESAGQYWRIISSPSSEMTSDLIEPTAMYAVALIGSGQVAEGLTQAEQMFQRIKAANGANVDEVDEGIEFVTQYMSQMNILDPRVVELVPQFQQSAFTPAQSSASLSTYENSFDPYAASTDFKGSSLIIDELERGSNGRNKVSKLNEAMTRFRIIRRLGRHPRYITYAKLISAAAREERMNLVHDILAMAKTDVPLLPQYSVVRYGWASILDSMVGACLTLGNRTLAAQYHQELLDMGCAPTANTFGLYITTLKESTKTFDEASEAVKIFHRAKSEGVEPSSFLYNALIGKLGKARRIDDCLFYFAEMRSLNVRPTSVTYGTIVNALCRVSDEKFAEELFEEMESMPNYKARPAPYNSLMQFFLTTKRDKSKVLSYYERMQNKGIQPTNHTYKLLVDAHATLEPVNMPAAEAVLDVIRSTGQTPEAVHYSSLIHAKGCVLHDVAGARQIFDSVMSDPSIRPQACLFQALFESMVANHCVADTEEVLQNMARRRVDMTPYIANTLIHGWANEKNIAKAEAIFGALGREKREPSTYEAMTRAYLVAEDRQSANNVVGEMLSRGYPSAVSGKICELLGGGEPNL